MLLSIVYFMYQILLLTEREKLISIRNTYNDDTINNFHSMLRFLPLLTSLLVIGFTTLVSIPGSPYLIGGMTQADISALYPTAITPAWLTFAIWSIIYLSWIVTGVYLAFFSKKSWAVEWVHHHKRIFLLYSLALLLTAVWLVPWGLQMIGTALIIILVLLGILKYVFHHTRKNPGLLHWSVELTLGWINIATVANVTVWLVSLGFTWGGIPEVYWAIGVLGLALILTAYYQCRYRAYIISLVFLWTMIGVWIAHPVLEERVAVAIYSFVTIVNILYSFMKKK